MACVDPYELARLGLSYLAGADSGLQLVGGVADPADLPALIARTDPDVVVIGDRLPEAGADLTRSLRAGWPRIGLVMVSHQHQEMHLRRGREIGLSAFVGRSVPVSTIAEAIRYAADSPRGFRCFQPGDRSHPEPAVVATPPLSPREHQVLALLADGLTAADIAEALQLGRGTVRTYITRLYAKLRVSNRSQALIATAGEPPGPE